MTSKVHGQKNVEVAEIDIEEGVGHHWQGEEDKSAIKRNHCVALSRGNCYKSSRAKYHAKFYLHLQ